MTRILPLFSSLILMVSCFHVKIANTAGKNTFAVMSCVSHDPDWTKIGPGDIANGKDWQFNFTPEPPQGVEICSPTRVRCAASVRKGNDHFNTKKAGFDVFNRCENGEYGYFLRGDGVYRGTMSGKNIKRIAKWCTGDIIPGKGCSG